MDKKNNFILWFKDIGIEDVPLVGGKNAALGEMYRNLSPLGINIPNGFTITAPAYRHFLKQSGLEEKIKQALAGLNTKNIKNLQKRGREVRELILKAELPPALRTEIISAYKKLGEEYGPNPDVAVRSSATAEDLPGASFAGQQETYLNVVGAENVLRAVKKCIASLFTDRAISYRVDQKFSQFAVALSVGIQKMVRSDLGSSGVMFTIDTETGFEDVVVINGSYGLGEIVVQGKIVPDEFLVFKPALAKGFKAIIGQDLGKKQSKIIYSQTGTKEIKVTEKDQAKFCLSEAEALRLAEWGIKIEEYFSQKHNRRLPMDIEWAKDGKTGKLFIVQARPETVHSLEDKNIYKEYFLKAPGRLLLTGMAVGTKIGSGKARIIKDAKKIGEFKKGEVLVTEITNPDWEPIMKIASAIVTDKGGRTSHAAIVSRELGIPCVVGAGHATRTLKTGENVTVDCSGGETGKIYEGILQYETREHRLDKMPTTRTKVMVNISTPEEAFKNHFLPVKGVGLGRLEFIIATHIQIHPNALIEYEKLKKNIRNPRIRKIIKKIDELTAGYKDKTRFYIDELAEGIAKIGAAFYPNETIIRFSDFKTNEYRKLIGGELYEPTEENPMLGWRGASRYSDPKFKEAFGLECKALKKVREEMGLKNIIPMIPFCRTPEEARKVLTVMESYGLSRGTTQRDTRRNADSIGMNQYKNPPESALRDSRLSAAYPSESEYMKVYVMAEIPSNIILADEFLDIFDGMSIGSNDLTQLALGLDRDSGIVTHIANENNPAVKKMIAEVIAKCRARGKYIGICGQAPSDYPEFTDFLIEKGIESVSLNPDTVVKELIKIAEKEKNIW